MSPQILDDAYEITEWPNGDPTILYLRVGDEVPAAAVAAVGGWRVILFRDEQDSLGANVGDAETAAAWLHSLGACWSRAAQAVTA